jgi:hypothetical protein
VPAGDHGRAADNEVKCHRSIVARSASTAELATVTPASRRATSSGVQQWDRRHRG